jgi:membrane-bound serine protease (ClpP class)
MTLAWVIILFVAGVALIAAEIFVPGMICGIVGTLCLLAGCAWGVYNYPDYGLFIVVVYFAGGVGAVVGAIFLLPRTRMGKALILQDGIAADEDWVSTVSDESLIGAEGAVFTPLRPAGTIVVDSKRVDAVSSGEYIDKGEAVRIIEVHGNRVVVEHMQSGA